MTVNSLDEAARALRTTLAGYHGWWGAAGGWAIDLYLNRVTRAHEDLEIVALRRDFVPLHAQLAARGPRLIHTGDGEPTFEPWHGAPFPEHVIQLRMEPSFDVLLTPAEAGDWICRRDESVRLPLPGALRATVSGVPVLAPEIVLLFKAKRVEEKDESDFRNALPSLGPAARSWLAARLEHLYPGHSWLGSL